MDKYRVTIDDEQALNLLDALVDAIGKAEHDLDVAESDNDHEAVEVYRDKYFAYSAVHDAINNQIVDIVNARV